MLTWDFKNKIGYVDSEEFTLYHGNALMINLYEENATWRMDGFFIDKDHAKRCLEDGLYKDTTFFLKRSSKDKRTTQLAQILAKFKISVVWYDDEETSNN